MSAETSRRAALLAIAACAAGALGVWCLGSGRLDEVAARFAASGDPRPALWADSLRAAAGYWPAGSGVGTFPLAILPYEHVFHLDPAWPNRAHSEYLELLVEAGVLAPFVLVCGLALIAGLVRRTRPLDTHCLFALGTLAIIALHALLDYPLRNMATACLAGIATGFLAAAGRRAERGGESSR